MMCSPPHLLLLVPPPPQVITVGLGSPASARAFSRSLGYPASSLYADPTGACCAALGFSPGFGEGVDVDPYLKLLPMLMGVGSPGTLQEVGACVYKGGGLVGPHMCSWVAALEGGA